MLLRFPQERPQKERLTMLTELKIKNLKPREKKYMLRDERGLYLRVDPNGKKYFIFRFFENKKERQFSLGTYPDISLKDARIKPTSCRDGVTAANIC